MVGSFHKNRADFFFGNPTKAVCPNVFRDSLPESTLYCAFSGHILRFAPSEYKVLQAKGEQKPKPDIVVLVIGRVVVAVRDATVSCIVVPGAPTDFS